jgi:serine/threonine protein phosphatase PrpC
MQIDCAACTHVGRRDNNEDAHCVDPATGVFAVADGMGGYEGGEVASRLAIDAFRAQIRDRRADVAAAVSAADAAVAERKRGRLARMGSTLAALVVVAGERAVVAHVGDSRVYLLRDGALHQLTRDHSLYNEFCASGLAPPDPDAFPFPNVITRALGMSGAAAPDLATYDLRAGDVYLVCSDGLYNPLGEARIAEILARRTPQDACATLVSEAFRSGGQDNITAVVARVS